MVFWTPEPGAIAELKRKAMVDAKGNAQLAENYLYAALFNRETGLFGDTDDYRPTWEKGVYTRRRLRRREWIERYFPIRDKAGKIVYLKLKPAQRRLELAILRMERAGIPVRIQILKARQMGFSTYAQGIFYELTLRGSHIRCLIVANSNDQAKKLLEMTRVARTQMRKGGEERWDFGMRSKSAAANSFDAPIDGDIKVESAETENAGRGGTLTGAHMSETSRFPRPSTYADVLASLPSIPGTICLDESTASGDVGRFAKDFWRYWRERDVPLEHRENPWVAVFSPWFEDPDYAWSRTVGFGRPMPAQLAENIMSGLDEEETWLLQQKVLRRWRADSEWIQVEVRETREVVIGGRGPDARIVGTRPRRHTVPLKVWRRVGVGWQPLTVDELAWRRFKIADKEIGGDVNLFNQEYPSRPEVAFLASGRPVFDISAIDRQLADARGKKPLFTGSLRLRLDRATTTGGGGQD